MSVDPKDPNREVWTRWQGHVVNGAFPLGRYLGSSDHSGVFLTESATRSPSSVAIKLVPTDRAQAEVLLPRWKRAGGLVHPHLLRLWEWGGCQLGGLPHLYLVMEYADQTLAQLLRHRALTDGEAREMLPPVLDALAFLHGRNLVHGRLKPANILVVGDQLKLASDTLRRVSEGAIGPRKPTVYDPPEARPGGSAAAGDIWGLGISLSEALTQRPLPGTRASSQALMPPPELSPAFRDIVARCLAARPEERPSVAQLQAWVRGDPAGAAPIATVPSLVSRSPKTRVPPWVILAAVAILALAWAGVRLHGADRTVPRARGRPAAISLAHAPVGAAPAAARVRAIVSAAPTAATGRPDALAPPSEVHEVIPEVPRSARRTIRGHIKVWVRVSVDREGAVQTAVADRPGPSRYFLRLALEAARRWTFPPVNAPVQRLMQVRFDFSRGGTSGRAVTLP